MSLLAGACTAGRVILKNGMHPPALRAGIPGYFGYLQGVVGQSAFIRPYYVALDAAGAVAAVVRWRGLRRNFIRASLRLVTAPTRCTPQSDSICFDVRRINVSSTETSAMAGSGICITGSGSADGAGEAG